MKHFIEIRGARVNNLKDVDIDIPLRKLICFFGASGSGKSSLAFHTLYTESKRRFLNSFPTYLKFFSERPAPVDVDSITPVLPVFGLPQVNPVVGTRSNVADTMHLTELLQNLFYHYSQELCPEHFTEFEERYFQGYIQELVKDTDGVFTFFTTREQFLEAFSKNPFPSRSMKSMRSKKIEEFNSEHNLWEVLRFKPSGIKDLNEKMKDYLEAGITLYLYSPGKLKLTEIKFKKDEFVCPLQDCTQHKLKAKSPMHFSPYNALGACRECNGFGEVLNYDRDKLVDIDKSISDGGVSLLNYKRFLAYESELVKVLKKNKISLTKPISELPEKFWTILYEGEGSYLGFNSCFKYLERKRYKMHVRVFIRKIQSASKCSACSGSRLRPFSKQFFLSDKLYSIFDLSNLTVQELFDKITSEQKFFSISRDFKKNIDKTKLILQSAVGIGLGHLSLNRKSKSLSAGEYQRLLLLKYLSYEGAGALFIFDEPSLGLSTKEQKQLLKSFKLLIDQHNTVIVIDHSEYIKSNSEYLVEMGPGSGKLGGEVLFEGKSSDYNHEPKPSSLKKTSFKAEDYIIVDKPQIYQKEFTSFKLPVDGITWVSGSSGTGKSSSLVNVLAAKIHYDIYLNHLGLDRGGAKQIVVPKKFKDVIIVDANLTRYTSRSTVGSMTELFGVIRKHYAKTSMARALGLKEGHFSYHSNLGQCPKCEGRGVQVIEMQFLEDIVLTCEDCDGKKLKPVYASISDGNLTVHESYSLPLNQVLKNIKLTPKFQRIFEYLKVLNLDYLSLNRTMNSLSGGEKQRVYLLNSLVKEVRDSFIILENISFGLSGKELHRICKFLQDLNKKKNTIVIIDQEDIFKSISHHKISFD